MPPATHADVEVSPGMPGRARALAAISIVLGAASFLAAPPPLPSAHPWLIALLSSVGVGIHPLASAFPWLTLLLALGGVVAGVAALRSRPRGRAEQWLGWAGLAASMALPLLVVFVFVRYLNLS